MNLIDRKLINPYTVLVLAEKYIIEENERTKENQKLVPQKYREEVEILVAERTIKILG